MSTDPAPNSECIFCKIVAGEIPCFKIYEDDATLAFMDINPGNPGHCLVIPKNHAPDAYSIDAEDFAAVARTCTKVAPAVRDVVSPDGINLVQANGAGAGQSVFHVHMHILPRWKDDNLPMNWGHKPGDLDQAKALGEKIAARIAS